MRRWWGCLIFIMGIPKWVIQTSGNPLVLGPWPVKTVEDPWKPLLCRSSCPVKNSSREPLYVDWGLLCGKNYIRSCKSFGGPVKLGFSMWLLVLRSSKSPKVFPMSVIYLHIESAPRKSTNCQSQSVINEVDIYGLVPQDCSNCSTSATEVLKSCVNSLAPGRSGPRLNIRTVLSTYGNFHVKDKTAVRTSYL